MKFAGVFFLLINVFFIEEFAISFPTRLTLRQSRPLVKSTVSENAFLESGPPYQPPAPLPTDDDLKKDLVLLKSRIEKLEKVTSARSIFDLSTWFDGKSIGLNKRTIEVCSIISFFFIGSILASTIFDRLWFVGGLLTAWWASVVINTSAPAGVTVRRVGIQLAQLIIDIRERANQAYIFYRTGKLAYQSSKIWEAVDRSYDVTARVDTFKRFAMIRASQFNNFLGERKYTDQLLDVWRALVSVPTEARRINVQYGVSAKVLKFSRHVLSSVRNFASDIITGTDISSGYGTAVAPAPKQTKRVTSGRSSSASSKQNSNVRTNAVERVRSVIELFFKNRDDDDHTLKRGRLVNPWIPFWDYLPKYTYSRRNDSKARSWRMAIQ